MVGNILPGSDGVIAWEFQHPAFQRDRPELLSRIKRKSSKQATAAMSSSIPPARKSVHSMHKSSTQAPSPKDDTPTADSDSDATVPASRPGGMVVPDYFPDRQLPRRASGSFNTSRPDRGASSGARSPSRGADPSTSDSPHRRSPPTVLSAGTFPLPNPRLSPTSVSYTVSSHPYPPAYTVPAAVSTGDDGGPARQIATLEAQVRSLGDALYFNQQENAAARGAMCSIMSNMLNVLDSLDANGERKADSEPRARQLPQMLYADSRCPY